MECADCKALSKTQKLIINRLNRMGKPNGDNSTPVKAQVCQSTGSD
jgi:hypothetical protein